ncbi:hypothetical protein BDZ89DRAFT_928153, partial [Hymenopellis radicata]
RPDVLSKWIHVGRLTKKKAMPTTLNADNLAAFKRSYATWYDSLQPGWREKDENGWQRPKLRRKQREWGFLDVRGVNGFLSIVACLYWWGVVAAELDQGEFDEWEQAVMDASWVLQK